MIGQHHHSFRSLHSRQILPDSHHHILVHSHALDWEEMQVVQEHHAFYERAKNMNYLFFFDCLRIDPPPPCFAPDWPGLIPFGEQCNAFPCDCTSRHPSGSRWSTKIKCGCCSENLCSSKRHSCKANGLKYTLFCNCKVVRQISITIVQIRGKVTNLAGS